MGNSHKRDSFAKTGQFGVGLNCMYHLSDAWLLLANDCLHLFGRSVNICHLEAVQAEDRLFQTDDTDTNITQ